MYCLGIQFTDAEIKSIHFEMKQKGQLFHLTPEGFCLCFFLLWVFFSPQTIVFQHVPCYN